MRKDIDVQRAGRGVIENQWRSGQETCVGNLFEIDRAEQGIGWNFSKNACKFPCKDALDGLVKGFANGFIQIDHTVRETFLNFERIHIGEFDL